LVATFEDYAVEFVIRYGDWEVSFGLSPTGEAGEEFGVEEGDPSCLRRGSPMQKREKGACRVVYAWILLYMVSS